MAHNGIEYADMQLICEAYQLMRATLGLDPEEMSQVFAEWNQGVLDSYLVRITSEILRKKDGKTGAFMVDGFLENCFYSAGGYDDLDGFQALARRLRVLENDQPTRRILYLSLPPFVFPDAIRSLGAAGLSGSGDPTSWTRLVIEKPFGRDRRDAENLNRIIREYFNEPQVYRIDHYLGKEVVQNLIALRFANRVFESIWHQRDIASVRLDWRETGGVAGRGRYFDKYGIIRDVMQNHLLQVLALVAMEPPAELSAQELHARRLDVLRHVISTPPGRAVLGQYGPGRRDGQDVCGYTDDESVPNDSRTPTYAATALYVDRPRWRDVPFIVSAGKALDRKLSEIVITFRPVEARAFQAVRTKIGADRLVIRIQPDAAINLHVRSKKPGLDFAFAEQKLDFSYDHESETPLPEAYESVLMELLRGDKTLFPPAEIQEAAWDIVDPMLRQSEKRESKLTLYPFGSVGPEWSADEVCGEIRSG